MCGPVSYVFCAVFFSDLLDSPSGLELMIPADVIEMEDNALGLRLEEAASIENITISVQTAVLRCMYWKEDVEMWWDHGCTVEICQLSVKTAC